LTECHVSNGDTMHLIVREVAPIGIDTDPSIPNSDPPNPPQPPNQDEEMDDIEQDFDPEHGEGGVSNLLNQIFEDIQHQTSMPTPNRFLIDQLRRNLNLWDRDRNLQRNVNTSNPSANENTPVPYPDAWTPSVTDLRQAFQACQDQVNGNLPQLYARANQLVAQDRPEDTDQFRRDMRHCAINFRRLGKIFTLLGRICQGVEANDSGLQVNEPRQNRRYNFNGMVVTQTHLNLNAPRRPSQPRGVNNAGLQQRNRTNQPTRPPSQQRPMPSIGNIMNLLRQQHNPRRPSNGPNNNSNNNNNQSNPGPPPPMSRFRFNHFPAPRVQPRPNQPTASNPSSSSNANNPLNRPNVQIVGNPFSMFVTATRRLQVPHSQTPQPPPSNPSGPRSQPPPPRR